MELLEKKKAMALEENRQPWSLRSTTAPENTMNRAIVPFLPMYVHLMLSY